MSNFGTEPATEPGDCGLCLDSLGPQIAGSAYWRLILNRNQNLLGKCFLVSRRHTEAVASLSSAEWAELHSLLASATAALTATFQPDHFNYAFLQNQDRHVHLHVIPRYQTARQWSGLTFTDPDYPDHYAVPMPDRRLNASTALRLGQLLAAAMSPG
jgi:diadenosine tetraphosphate (Ap4A) HIT family hydrolase